MMVRVKRIGTIAALLSLCGCSPMDRLAMTEFRPIDESTFEYKAAAAAVYPEGSESAEAKRY